MGPHFSASVLAPTHRVNDQRERLGVKANCYISTNAIRSAEPEFGLLAISTKKKIAQDPMTSQSRVKRERLMAFIVDWIWCIGIIGVDQGGQTCVGQAILENNQLQY